MPEETEKPEEENTYKRFARKYLLTALCLVTGVIVFNQHLQYNRDKEARKENKEITKRLEKSESNYKKLEDNFVSLSEKYNNLEAQLENLSREPTIIEKLDDLGKRMNNIENSRRNNQDKISRYQKLLNGYLNMDLSSYLPEELKEMGLSYESPVNDTINQYQDNGENIQEKKEVPFSQLPAYEETPNAIIYRSTGPSTTTYYSGSKSWTDQGVGTESNVKTQADDNIPETTSNETETIE